MQTVSPSRVDSMRTIPIGRVHRRNFTTGLVLVIFKNMKTRILMTILVTVALFVGGSAQAQSPPPSVADIKVLAKGGISEEVILSQIRNSHAVYRLSTAEILNQLGITLNWAGLPVEGEQTLRRAIAITRKVFGPDSPNVGVAEGNLAFSLVDQGKFAEAEAISR